VTRDRAFDHVAGFAPLDLGEDPMSWPSETDWPDTSLPEPSWPSAHWDDPHFGRHGAARPKLPARARTSGAKARADEKEPAALAKRLAQARMAELKNNAEELIDRTFQQVGSPTDRVAQEAKRAAAELKQQVAADVPGAEELEALVRQHGLAGAVQAVMKRTGWDFKTAAQYLAKVRQGR